MSDPQIPKSPSRKDYTENAVYRAVAKANETPIFERNEPFALFSEWMAEARISEPNDSNAMSLATVDKAGFPDVRIVLLKEVSEDGFVFYTNGQSAKGQQLAQAPRAALALHWKSLRRQVRVRGIVKQVSAEQADAYFASRAREARLGAWASDQSMEMESRQTFEDRLAALAREYEGKEVPRPPHWKGWCVEPQAVEFWRDRPFRLHDRLVFTKTANAWTKSRLYP